MSLKQKPTGYKREEDIFMKNDNQLNQSGPGNLPVIVMNHQQIIDEEILLICKFYQEMGEFHQKRKDNENKIEQMDKICLEKYCDCDYHQKTWQITSKILGDNLSQYPFITLDRKERIRRPQIGSIFVVGFDEKIEDYTIDLVLLRDIIQKGTEQAVYDKKIKELKIKEEKERKEKEEKYANLIKKFGQEIMDLPGLVEFLARTSFPDSNEFVKIYPEYEMAVYIKEHQWWSRGSGTGKKAIVGIFNNGQREEKEFQFRDQYSSYNDNWSLWFVRAELVEIKEEEVILKCYPRRDDDSPRNISIPIKLTKNSTNKELVKPKEISDQERMYLAKIVEEQMKEVVAKNQHAKHYAPTEIYEYKIDFEQKIAVFVLKEQIDDNRIFPECSGSYRAEQFRYSVWFMDLNSENKKAKSCYSAHGWTGKGIDKDPKLQFLSIEPGGKFSVRDTHGETISFDKTILQFLRR